MCRAGAGAGDLGVVWVRIDEKPSCTYLLGVALFPVDESHPVNYLRGCKEGIQCAEVQDGLRVRSAMPLQVLQGGSSSREAYQG